MKNFLSLLIRTIRRPFAILEIRILQYRYQRLLEKSRGNQTNQILSELRFIQYKLYYFKEKFNAWGYYHPSCIWTDESEKTFRKLFPARPLASCASEPTSVTMYNPELITFYFNEIYDLSKGRLGQQDLVIKGRKQLVKWNKNN